ncbi:hypothetical protein UPYG_G00054140 [Umbra pygmaea]|uniref:AIG1-type G domain-containing protein n=1 Tax=Umbra pygmaea TaxID=75934 RepID=A0ABD0XB07_UMBPY
MSAQSVTRECKMQIGSFNKRRVDVIDTPGLFHTELTEEGLKKEIQRCLNMSMPGPHVFLLVIRIGLRNIEEKNTMKWIQRFFGDDSSMYTIVLFTHGDLLQRKTIKEFCQENKELQSIINQCGCRYHVFNNKEKNDLIRFRSC